MRKLDRNLIGSKQSTELNSTYKTREAISMEWMKGGYKIALRINR